MVTLMNVGLLIGLAVLVVVAELFSRTLRYGEVTRRLDSAMVPSRRP